MTARAPLVHELLSAAADARPDHPAIRHAGQALSYAKADARAAGISAALLGLGVRPGDRVGVQLGKRPEAIAALFGVLRAGGVVVPLDHQAPAPYVASIVGDAAMRTLMTTPELLGELLAEDGASGLRSAILLQDGRADGHAPGTSLDWLDYTETANGQAPGGSASIADDALAAVTYTSGSSGRPKGVMLRHRTVVSLVGAYVERMGIGVDDRLCVYPPLHFRQSMYGYVAAALAAATAVLIPMTMLRGADLARLISDESITIWKSTPHPLRAVVEARLPDGSLPSLRHIMSGGGWRAADIRALWRLAPNATIWHSYGSTETSTVFIHPIREVHDGQPIPIGKPVAGVRVRLVDAAGRPTPQTEAGELYVQSDRMLDGYWGDPDRTTAVLVPDPTGAEPDGPAWFRTGDILRQREDGDYEFLGRGDSMIKSRGYRIELGQVERAMLDHPDVRDAVAVAVPHADWETAIVAFVEPASGRELEAGRVRAHVRSRLPDHMVPLRIECLAQLPRLANGKVDRARLAAIARVEADVGFPV